jgi:hypothetical protein
LSTTSAELGADDVVPLRSVVVRDLRRDFGGFMRLEGALSARGLAAGGALVGGAALLRRRYLRWGATEEEVRMALPGDDLVAQADLTATRAIATRAAAEDVWPWVAQIGQGRGGFYTYDALENLVGCDIHSADEIVPAWQAVEVGDEVNLHPQLALAVAVVDRGRALVLRGGVPMGETPAPYDFTWAFVLRDGQDGGTRLVVRERYGYSRRWASLIVEPVELISFVMSQRMLRGIRERAERGAVSISGAQVKRDPTLTEHPGPGSVAPEAP